MNNILAMCLLAFACRIVFIPHITMTSPTVLPHSFFMNVLFQWLEQNERSLQNIIADGKRHSVAPCLLGLLRLCGSSAQLSPSNVLLLLLFHETVVALHNNIN